MPTPMNMPFGGDVMATMMHDFMKMQDNPITKMMVDPTGMMRKISTHAAFAALAPTLTPTEQERFEGLVRDMVEARIPGYSNGNGRRAKD